MSGYTRDYKQVRVKVRFAREPKRGRLRKGGRVILEQIKKMDKKSEEFFEVYRAVTEKYFDFDDPDEYQRHADERS